MPVVLSDDTYFGTLCAVDPEPRSLSRGQEDLLAVLARLLVTQFDRDKELKRRRQTQRALERQSVILRRQAELLDLAHDAIIVRDLGTSTILYWNQGAEEMYGWAKGEARGRKITGLLVPQFPKPLEDMNAEVVRTGRWEGELQHIRRDGERIVVASRWALQRDERGAPAAILEINSDITERKELERQLAEDRSRSLVQNASDIITIIEANGTVRYQSPSIQRVLGYDPQDLAGTSIFAMVHPDDLPSFERLVRESLATPESSPWAEVRMRHQEGLWCYVDAYGKNLLDDPSVAGVVITLHDISERKRAEEERRFKHAAEQANKAKSEFLSRMSHELRTPLNAVLGFGELLTLGDLPPRQQRQAELIVKSGKHLLNLIDEVLDISAMEAGRLRFSLEPVSVRDTALESLDLVRPMAAERNIRIDDSGLRDSAHYVLADQQRLRQVMLNLLSNAIKYNREGGLVTVSISQLDEELVPEHAPGVSRLPCLRLWVADTGFGIASEKMDRLFVPFDRLDAERTEVEGTGLGLALSQRLTEAMGGTLEVESVVGQGSTFYVELPLAESQLARHARLGGARLMPGEVDGTTGRILYVEDNLSNLELIEQILALRPGVELISAMQGRIGLDLAREHRPNLVLLDLHLPDITGQQVLRELQENDRTRSIPVVVISADASPHEIHRVLSVGARDYLTKPIDVRQFLQVLDEVLQGSAV